MIFARLATVVGAVAGVATAAAQSAFVNQTTCNGKQYTYQELVGCGTTSRNARDEFGDTIAGLGLRLRSIPVGEAGKWKQYWSSLVAAGSRLVSLTTFRVNWSDEIKEHRRDVGLPAKSPQVRYPLHSRTECHSC
jgi:hypothetical protein